MPAVKKRYTGTNQEPLSSQLSCWITVPGQKFCRSRGQKWQLFIPQLLIS